MKPKTILAPFGFSVYPREVVEKSTEAETTSLTIEKR